MSTRAKYCRWVSSLPCFHDEFYSARLAYIQDEHTVRWLRFLGVVDHPHEPVPGAPRAPRDM